MAGSQPSYEFGPFRLDACKRLLMRDGEPVALTPQILETLLALVEHRDRVISKDELVQRIWGDTVVEETGLTRNVSVLRKTLGEKPDDHQYIVTVPGRGYQFVADVRDAVGKATADTRLPAAASAGVDSRKRLRPSTWLMVGGVAGLLAGLFWLFLPHFSGAAGAVRHPISAVAVLPLDNLSGDPSQEYFADGMTEAIIATLARVRALRVVSRTSVMRFKGTPPPLPEIARMLNVDAVVEGSVQRDGDRVRINVQLVHAPSDMHLWSREYERQLTDVLKLQAEVARAVADEIRVQITAEERAVLASAARVNPDAYKEYLLGQHYLWRLNEEDLARAIAHFEESARLEPGHAATYAGLSHAWWWRGLWGASTSSEVEAPSRAAAARALALDPRLPEAHVSSGRIKFGYGPDLAGAEQDFKHALALDPNNVDAHFFSAMLCMALGCFPESIAHMKLLEQRDPLSATVQSFFGRVLYRARRFDEAIAHLKRAIELEPRNPAGAYHRLVEVYEQLGRYDEALALLREASNVEDRSASVLHTARIHARMGKRKEAKEALAAQSGANPRMLATVHAALGNNDEAFRLLFKAIDEPRGLIVYVNTDPPFDSLQSDPRWATVLHRLNFPTDRMSAPPNPR